MESITIFQAKDNGSKVPYSPFEDNTFDFRTFQSDDIHKLFNTMVSNWVLNIPLAKLDDSGYIKRRRKADLQHLYNDNISYIVLDIDDIKSQEDQDKVLEFFKDYKCILGESKTANGITKFNLKGIMFIEPINIHDAKKMVQDLHYKLKDYCTMDEAVTRMASYNAPIGKNKILLDSSKKSRYKFVPVEIEHSDEVAKEYIKSANLTIDAFQELPGDTIPELCLNTFKSMGFEAIKNNHNGSITFKHPNETKSPGGFFWFQESPYTMNHNNSTKKVDIYSIITKTPRGKELIKEEVSYDNSLLSFNTDTKIINVNNEYLEVTDEIADNIDEWLNNDNGLFSIKSPMGTGKSTIINYLIQEAHEIDMSVLIITNRRSVAQDFSKKYNIKHYQHHKYETNDSMVVQYDSLWKYNIKNFDVIIMDEFISLMNHSRNNMNNSIQNISKFFASFQKKLVIADAFLTGYENFLLNNKKKNIVQVDNHWRDGTVLYDYDNESEFVNNILQTAQKHKCTISGTSLNFLEATRALLVNKGLNVFLLTAETPDTTKKLVYDLFESEDHDKWDVFMYSPTLTVGVSNLNRVQYHFHYDSSMSTDVISSIQMIKRTRKAKEIHMHIKDRVKYLKTSYNAIRDEYMNNMGRQLEQSYLFDIDDYGEAKLSNTGKNALKIDTFKNILEFNHKGGFMWMLKYHFLNDPRKPIKSVFSLESGILTRAKKLIKDNKELEMRSNIEQFLTLTDIEKTDILMGDATTKNMRQLAEIEDSIKDDTNNIIKTRIINICLKNRQFIQQCKYYQMTYYYTKKIYDASDVQVKVSEAVMSNDHDSLKFYNSLLKYGQVEIFDEYYIKSLKEQKLKKYILEKIGYKNRKAGLEVLFRVDPDIKELYGYIK